MRRHLGSVQRRVSRMLRRGQSIMPLQASRLARVPLGAKRLHFRTPRFRPTDDFDAEDYLRENPGVAQAESTRDIDSPQLV